MVFCMPFKTHFQKRIELDKSNMILYLVCYVLITELSWYLKKGYVLK